MKIKAGQYSFKLEEVSFETITIGDNNEAKVTHLATGVSAACSDTKSTLKNRMIALEELGKLIYETEPE